MCAVRRLTLFYSTNSTACLIQSLTLPSIVERIRIESYDYNVLWMHIFCCCRLNRRGNRFSSMLNPFYTFTHVGYAHWNCYRQVVNIVGSKGMKKTRKRDRLQAFDELSMENVLGRRASASCMLFCMCFFFILCLFSFVCIYFYQNNGLSSFTR